jgi:AraC-like DNA-binding protein
MLLRNHTVLLTNDVAELHAHVAGTEGPHERSVDRSQAVRLELRQTALHRLDIAVLDANVAIELSARRKRAADFLVQFPLTGQVELEIDDASLRFGPGEGLVISPGQRVRRRASPGWTIAVRVPGMELRKRIARGSGPPVERQSTFGIALREKGAPLLDYVLFVIDAIDRGAVTHDGTTARVLAYGFIDLLLELALDAQKLRKGASIVDAASERVRRVRELAARTPNDALDVQTLARAAGCSVRTLQATFARLGGLSPMEFVRRERLELARRLLQDAAQPVRVTEAAIRTGFPHVARFAQAYRARFGETPSQTLRRRRTGRGEGRSAR